MYATVDGDDFEGTDAGLGLDLQGRVAFNAFSIGAGWQRTSHDIDVTSDNIIATAFYLEPRFTFPTATSLAPFLTFKVGRAKQAIEVDDPDFGSIELESSGWLFGGGAGLAFPVGGIASLNLSASYAHLSFGDVEVDGDAMPDTESSGSSVMLRAGLSFQFGGR